MPNDFFLNSVPPLVVLVAILFFLYVAWCAFMLPLYVRSIRIEIRTLRRLAQQLISTERNKNTEWTMLPADEKSNN